ncbi:MAG: DUF1697 domain-containing protein [Planctomycetes bacterium]|nr:DUF1697 domain-containing protein [Planctomycetota bacterium]
MKTWIALLKGINMVGKHKMRMKDLIALLEGLNARDVKTYRGSGNAVFRHRGKDAGRLAKRISAAVGKAYEFKPLVMLLETEQLTRIIADNPFPEAEAEPGSLVVGFLTTEPEQPDWEAFEEVRRKSERFALHGDVFYFYAPEGFHKTKIGPWLKRSLRDVDGTGRTWGTVVKVMEMAKAMG